MRVYHPDKTPESNALTDLIRAVLRTHAHAQKCGARLIADLDLTNARWQTLGELVAAEPPPTVSRLARRMGLTRQAVQRLADDMAADGLVGFADNPADKRAKLVTPTAHGREVYAATLDREWRWTNAVAAGLDPAALLAAAAVLDAVAGRMADSG